MAVKYLKSGAAGAADGSTWADAYTTLVAALAGVAAGDTIYVSDNHAESTAAAATFTSPGTAASPCLIICSDDATEPPTARATTGTIATTGTNAHMNFAGFAYVYGLSFSAGTSGFTNMPFVSAAPWEWIFEDSFLQLNSSGGALQVGLSSNQTEDEQRLVLINTPLLCGGTGNNILCRTRMEWRNTPSAIQTTAPTTLFSSTIIPAQFLGVGLDLSLMGSGKNIVDVSGNAPARFLFDGCKLGASVSRTTGSIPSAGGAEVEFNNCDSGATNYKKYRQTYQGTFQDEIVIVRTGGATNGTTPFSRKLTSTANVKFFSPLVSEFQFWNETLSAITITVPILTDNVTLTDKEVWLEAQCLTDGSYPISAQSSDRIADPVFGTPANQTTDGTSAWTTTGLGTPVLQQVAITVTPAMKGLITLRVCLAKASTTLYHDLKPIVS